MKRLFLARGRAACVLLLLMCGVHGTAAACDADPNGPPNCAAAGNPINVITGNKFQVETDLPALPGVLGLEIVRYYNSGLSGRHNTLGVLGRGWRLSYESELAAIGDTVQIRSADGTRYIFSRDVLRPSLCNSTNPSDGTVSTRRTPAGEEFVWRQNDGRRLTFNQQGRLVQIQAPTGEFVSLQHDARGLLVKVTDPQGRSLVLNYLASKDAEAGDRFRGVQSIDSPVGRFGYGYGSPLPPGADASDPGARLANLVRVSLPGGQDQARLYHYEDARRPTFLTGVSVAGRDDKGKPVVERYSTFGYDIDGKAILSTHAGGADKVTLDTSVGGRTVLTNSLGQKTVYRYSMVAGAFRLLEVRGAGCALCGEMDVRYGYDSYGRMSEVTKLDRDGQPLHTTKTELDYYGRPRKVSKVVYHNGKAGAAELVARYEYADGTALTPSRIVRPSVVPGRELSMRIRYNNYGQVLESTEQGWSPGSDCEHKVDAIERTTRYRYSTINGRSLLRAIDGPLANGSNGTPVDSDITEIEWNAAGSSVVALTTPGNFRTGIEYDQVGRVAAVTDAEGQRAVFRYDVFSHLIGMERAGVSERMQYDKQGQLVEVGQGSGEEYKANKRFGFDITGRNIWIASRLGILMRNQFDTEGNVLETSIESANFKQRRRYGYDAFGRLTTVKDTAGGVHRIAWNAQDLPVAMRDAFGRDSLFRYDAVGNLSHVIESAWTARMGAGQAGIRVEHDQQDRLSGVIAANGAPTRYVRDDFGRTTAILNADSGLLLRRYDAADRLSSSVDAIGNEARYQYDLSGRIIRQVVTEVNAPDVRRQTVTAWTYAGTQLVKVDHPDQASTYRYDNMGRLIVKSVILKRPDGTPISSITSYRYDASGHLSEVSLPDGSVVEYQRNGQDQIVALRRRLIQTPWLRWLLPAQTIVSDIERDLIGLRGMTYGNGIQASYQRSKEGILARIVYRHPLTQSKDGAHRMALADVLGVASAQAAESQAPAPATASSSKLSQPGALGLAEESAALFDQRFLWDVHGNLLYLKGKDQNRNFAYDRRERLLAAGMVDRKSGTANFARYAYDDAGNRVLAQEDVTDQSDFTIHTVRSKYAAGSSRWTGGGEAATTFYDGNGQPTRIGQREYAWDAYGKLVDVRQDGQSLASYRYNHKGERIAQVTRKSRVYYLYENRKLTAELNSDGHITRQYIYLADQPIALVDCHGSATPLGTEPSQLEQLVTDIGTALRAWIFGAEAVAYLHNNHLGATELLTDPAGRVVWQAAYSPYGKIMSAGAGSGINDLSKKSSFQFNLRLPGQYEDEATGLYYNDHRYYDPQRGQYLTPDPLGLHGGMNSFGYAGANPLKNVDPSGLVLFAFDGTSNSENPPATDSISNVLKFYQAYDQTANGEAFYITGIGTTNEYMPYKGNIASGDGFDQRVDLAFSFLDKMIRADTATDALDLDIVGFSRGAAEARVWVNKLIGRLKNGSYSVDGKTRCINLRFEGLWDTVPHLGYLNGNESKYDFSIPKEVKYAVQAVALNEHRGGPVNFDGRSIMDSPGQSSTGNRIEKGFIGSHADIGGGYGSGDLSDVALMWMLKQAHAQGIMVDNSIVTKNGWDVVADPIIHDKSNNHADLGEIASTRNIVYGDGKSVLETDAAFDGKTTADTKGNISYFPNPYICGSSGNPDVGLVNMVEYNKWLASYGMNIGYVPVENKSCGN
jgi:RHS repeat-associated protein